MTGRVEHLSDTVTLCLGDCIEVLQGCESNSFDACVTDPPYGLGFMGKHWDSGKSFVERKPVRENRFDHVGGNHNPTSGVDAARTRRVEAQKYGSWCERWAVELFRVLKPGAHLLAFGGTRTYHRMACAIEDAGFEIRDCVMWLYGSGFPKSLDVSKAIDKVAGAEREIIGRRHDADKRQFGGKHIGWDRPWMHNPDACERHVSITAPATDAARQWSGYGTALKPACEPIVLARKPLSESTVAANVLKWGTGALNIDGCRITAGDKTPAPVGQYGGSIIGPAGHNGIRNGNADHLGRWPANIIHDGSDEVVGAFPYRKCGDGTIIRASGADANGNTGAAYGAESRPAGTATPSYGDEGSAARFFYTAKADSDDRLGSKHPTVKPLDLMQYLVRLVTPPGGLVIDPFAGTGTTGEAAFREGMRAVLIEKEEEYQDDIRRRMKLALAGPDERAREAAKARMKDKPVDHGPLFGSQAS